MPRRNRNAHARKVRRIRGDRDTAHAEEVMDVSLDGLAADLVRRGLASPLILGSIPPKRPQGEGAYPP